MTNDPRSIDIVPVERLHERLGFAESIQYPAESRHRSFLDWKMEVDDAPIFRYLYRNFRPRRHLEFGTWLGTGACYCLEESDASVWTMNLPAGELIDGIPAYSSSQSTTAPHAPPLEQEEQTVYQTDAGLFIGQKYREAGFGHRVCQIYCDSREWDTSAYPPDFFDSVLIDGGHAEDVVTSDTRKALSVCRPGALIMWHDFCPDPAVFSHFPSVVGVIGGVTEHWAAFASQLREAFWIQPSYLLIGIRA